MHIQEPPEPPENPMVDLAIVASALIVAGLIFMLFAGKAEAQPIIPEATAGSLGVCDSENAYPRAKIALEADVGDCTTDTLGVGTEEILCVCMPDGDGGYSWSAVAAGGGSPDLSESMISELSDINGVTGSSEPHTLASATGFLVEGHCVRWNAGGDLVGFTCPTDDQTAAEVTIADTGAFFAGSSVESALQEVGPTMADARAPTVHASTHGDGGADEVALDASQITTGTVGTARLGSGTADSTTYLRGDQTWATAGAAVPGSDTQVVFNDGGALGADAGLTYDKATDDLTLGGALRVQQGSLSDASIIFPVDAGIYNPTSSEIAFVTGGTARWRIAQSYFNGGAVGAPHLNNTASSLTDPNVRPYKNDSDSGIGCDGSDTCAGIAGGVNVLEWDNDGSVTRVTITGISRNEPEATAPASCTLGDSYVDTSGARCVCNVSGAWIIETDLSDGGSPNCT
jgi:hypothetical protein